MTEDKGAGGEVVEVDPVRDYFQARIVQEMITGGPLRSTRLALGEIGQHTASFGHRMGIAEMLWTYLQKKVEC